MGFKQTEYDLLVKMLNQNIDLHGRRVINAGNSQELQDYVTRSELNEVVSTGPVSGSGTTDHIPVFTNTTVLGDSFLYQSAGKINPTVDNTYQLGDATHKFSNIYVTATVINTVTYAWPGSQGAAGTYLKNDGAGNLSWAAATGGGSVGGTGTDTYIPIWINAGVDLGNSNIIDDGASVTLIDRDLYSNPNTNPGIPQFDLGTSTRNWERAYATQFLNTYSTTLVFGTTIDQSISIIQNNVSRWLVESGGNFRPFADNAYNMGDASVRIKDMYAMKVHGVTEVDTNAIVSTGTLAITGNVTIAGHINSVGNILPIGNLAYDLGAVSNNWTRIYTASVLKDTTGSVGITIGTKQADSILFVTNNIIRWQLDGNGHLYPNTTSSYDIGTSSLRVANYYGVAIQLTGNITIKSLAYVWPASHGSGTRYLTNDGIGNLSWTSISTGGVTGSGTSGKISKWNATTNLTDSIMTETTGNITVAGSMTLTSSNVLVSNGFGIAAGGTGIAMNGTRGEFYFNSILVATWDATGLH